MLRLMTLYIDFDGQTYLALVSVRCKDTGFVCQVRFVNSGLHYALPDNLLVFDRNGVAKGMANRKARRKDSLMSSTERAISKKLQAA